MNIWRLFVTGFSRLRALRASLPGHRLIIANGRNCVNS
jgi:hypothetical protein